MTTMRVAQIPSPKRPFEIVERPIPQPTPGTVRIKVSACGVCHSDALVKEGLWPGIQYPRVPGHEISGTIDAVGEGVIGWSPGQRVGVGWHGGYFSARAGVRSMNEIFPLERVNEAYDRMMSGKARFRVVLKME